MTDSDVLNLTKLLEGSISSIYSIAWSDLLEPEDTSLRKFVLQILIVGSSPIPLETGFEEGENVKSPIVFSTRGVPSNEDRVSGATFVSSGNVAQGLPAVIVERSAAIVEEPTVMVQQIVPNSSGDERLWW